MATIGVSLTATAVPHPGWRAFAGVHRRLLLVPRVFGSRHPSSFPAQLTTPVGRQDGATQT